MSELLALFVSCVFLFREPSRGSLSWSTQPSKGKEEHAVHEHSWQLEFVTAKIKKHSQVKGDKGREAGMRETGTPRRHGGVGRAVDTLGSGTGPFGEEPRPRAFFWGQRVPLLWVSEGPGGLGGPHCEPASQAVPHGRAPLTGGLLCTGPTHTYVPARARGRPSVFALARSGVRL